jgi:hypothetical protein
VSKARNSVSILRFPGRIASVQFTSMSNLTSGTCWHYTNADGLLGIVNKNELWASSPRVLKDSSELRYGISILKSALEEMEVSKEFSAEQVELLKSNIEFNVFEDIMDRLYVFSASDSAWVSRRLI